MALIQCNDCGKLISDKAKKCPQCNSQIKKSRKKLNLKKIGKKQLVFIITSFILLLSLIFLYYFVFSVPSLERIKDSVVKIEAYDNNNNLLATGSGFCAFKNNYIVTNFHVIEGTYSLKVVDDNNNSYKVNDVIIFDHKNDLAILDTDIKLKPVKINKGKIKTGQKVIAIGSPRGELNTVSEGIVSNSENNKGIQISAPISHGSSGGALFDDRHRLIGITYAGYDDAQNLNYAISVDYLTELYKALKDDDYYKINYSNYDNCVASNSGFNGCNQVSNRFYSVATLDIMYKISNVKSIYENNLPYDFKGLYDQYSEEDKRLIVSVYQELLNYDSCSIYACDIKNKLKTWNTNEFIINLDILDESELAFALVDLKNYNSKDSQFDRVENYPLEAAQKSLILYLIGDYTWQDIHVDNKEDIFNFLNGKIYNTSDLGSVLELLGYRVEYNDDGTLTAYWE